MNNEELRMLRSRRSLPLRTLTLFVSIWALCGCERFALDRKMEELCKKDGGVKVYETVTLLPEEYERVFGYKVRANTREDYYGPEYLYVSKYDVLVGKNAKLERGDGRLVRAHTAIYRRSDGRLLGEAVLYGRTGGDGFTFGLQSSGNLCPRGEPDLGRAVFVKGERQ